MDVTVDVTSAAPVEGRDDDRRVQSVDAERFERLRTELAKMGQLVVAFSGGADSAFLARVATDTLGPDRVLCVTAVSPSLAPEERADCGALAAEWGLRWQEVVTDELADPAYRANDG